MSLYSWILYGASFVLVISLIFCLRFAIRYLEPRLGRAGKTRTLQTIESLVIDPKRRLTLFSCAGKKGVLLTGGQSDLFLGWVDEPQAPSFADHLPPEIETHTDPLTKSAS